MKFLSIKKLNSIAHKIFYSNISFLLLTALLILEVIAVFSFDKDLHLYFLDVGQGDAILIKTPNYRYILVDGGEGVTILEELGQVLPYWKRSIDIVIGTHADSDHMGGLLNVLEEYQVTTFATSDIQVDDNNLEKILEIAEREEVEVLELDAGDFIDIDNIHLDVLWPEEDFEAENDNQNSVVLKGQYGQFSFLLTGDIEAEQENVIVSEYSSLSVNILKASHHGSKTATSGEFLEVVDPDYVVISCGADNKFGHPASEVMERLYSYDLEIFRTDENGRVEFVSDGYKIDTRLEK